ncbi:MAG: branched-chain amino acid ABC transporter permease [Candidatus Dormibacterales bacterium]
MSVTARAPGAGPSAAPGAGSRRWLVLLGWLAFAAALVAFPLVLTNSTYTSIGIFTLLFMASASAWNAFGGFSGYINLGMGVFWGTGAYTLSLAALDWHMRAGYSMFSLVALGGLAAAAIAVPFGFVALRTRRHTFVVITIGIFFIFQALAFNFSFTGGSSGLQPPSPPWLGDFFNVPFYYVALGVLAFAVLLASGMRHSRFGLQLLAIRDDEPRARGLGVKVAWVKLSAFVLTAIPVGMAGALYAYFVGQIFPQFAFDPTFDVTVALMSFFGGLGTITGPLLGALVLEPIQQYLQFTIPAGSLYLVIYGGLFLLVILFMPRGLIPSVRDRWLSRRAARRGLAEIPTEVSTAQPRSAAQDPDERTA